MDEEISNKKKYMSSFWKVYLINILWKKNTSKDIFQ